MSCDDVIYIFRRRGVAAPNGEEEVKLPPWLTRDEVMQCADMHSGNIFDCLNFVERCFVPKQPPAGHVWDLSAWPSSVARGVLLLHAGNVREWANALADRPAEPPIKNFDAWRDSVLLCTAAQ